MNLQRIALAAAVECERQRVGVRELAWLIDAYRWLSESDAKSGVSAEQVVRLGMMIEPQKNYNGFRTSPVVFRNGGDSANYASISRLLTSLLSAQEELTTDEFVREFLWIHPFADGNGRSAYILYNWLNGTMDDPDPLPDYNW